MDEHIEHIDLWDAPDWVCIETYITNTYRAYEIADSYRGIKSRLMSWKCVSRLRYSMMEYVY